MNSNNLIYYRIKLDSHGNESELHTIEEAFSKILKIKKEMENSGVSKNDPEYKNIIEQQRALQPVVAANRKAFLDVKEIVNDLANHQTKDLVSAYSQLKKQIQDLTTAGADTSALSEMRAQAALIRQEMAKRDIALRDIENDRLNIAKMSNAELKDSMKTAKFWLDNETKGTKAYADALRHAFAVKTQMDKQDGKMTLFDAKRVLADGDASITAIRKAHAVVTEYHKAFSSYLDGAAGAAFASRAKQAQESVFAAARRIATGELKATFGEMAEAKKILKQELDTKTAENADETAVKSINNLMAQLEQRANLAKSTIESSMATIEGADKMLEQSRKNQVDAAKEMEALNEKERKASEARMAAQMRAAEEERASAAYAKQKVTDEAEYTRQKEAQLNTAKLAREEAEKENATHASVRQEEADLQKDLNTFAKTKVENEEKAFSLSTKVEDQEEKLAATRLARQEKENEYNQAFLQTVEGRKQMESDIEKLKADSQSAVEAQVEAESKLLDIEKQITANEVEQKRMQDEQAVVLAAAASKRKQIEMYQKGVVDDNEVDTSISDMIDSKSLERRKGTYFTEIGKLINYAQHDINAAINAFGANTPEGLNTLQLLLDEVKDNFDSLQNGIGNFANVSAKSLDEWYSRTASVLSAISGDIVEATKSEIRATEDGERQLNILFTEQGHWKKEQAAEFIDDTADIEKMAQAAKESFAFLDSVGAKADPFQYLLKSLSSTDAIDAAIDSFREHIQSLFDLKATVPFDQMEQNGKQINSVISAKIEEYNQVIAIAEEIKNAEGDESLIQKTIGVLGKADSFNADSISGGMERMKNAIDALHKAQQTGIYSKEYMAQRAQELIEDVEADEARATELGARVVMAKREGQQLEKEYKDQKKRSDDNVKTVKANNDEVQRMERLLVSNSEYIHNRQQKLDDDIQKQTQQLEYNINLVNKNAALSVDQKKAEIDRLNAEYHASIEKLRADAAADMSNKEQELAANANRAAQELTNLKNQEKDEAEALSKMKDELQEYNEIIADSDRVINDRKQRLSVLTESLEKAKEAEEKLAKARAEEARIQSIDPSKQAEEDYQKNLLSAANARQEAEAEVARTAAEAAEAQKQYDDVIAAGGGVSIRQLEEIKKRLIELRELSDDEGKMAEYNDRIINITNRINELRNVSTSDVKRVIADGREMLNRRSANDAEMQQKKLAVVDATTAYDKTTRDLSNLEIENAKKLEKIEHNHNAWLEERKPLVDAVGKAQQFYDETHNEAQIKDLETEIEKQRVIKGREALNKVEADNLEEQAKRQDQIAKGQEHVIQNLEKEHQALQQSVVKTAESELGMLLHQETVQRRITALKKEELEYGERMQKETPLIDMSKRDKDGRLQMAAYENQDERAQSLLTTTESQQKKTAIAKETINEQMAVLYSSERQANRIMFHQQELEDMQRQLAQLDNEIEAKEREIKRGTNKKGVLNDAGFSALKQKATFELEKQELEQTLADAVARDVRKLEARLKNAESTVEGLDDPYRHFQQVYIDRAKKNIDTNTRKIESLDPVADKGLISHLQNANEKLQKRIESYTDNLSEAFNEEMTGRLKDNIARERRKLRRLESKPLDEQDEVAINRSKNKLERWDQQLEEIKADPLKAFNEGKLAKAQEGVEKIRQKIEALQQGRFGDAFASDIERISKRQERANEIIAENSKIVQANRSAHEKAKDVIAESAEKIAQSQERRLQAVVNVITHGGDNELKRMNAEFDAFEKRYNDFARSYDKESGDGNFRMGQLDPTVEKDKKEIENVQKNQMVAKKYFDELKKQYTEIFTSVRYKNDQEFKADVDRLFERDMLALQQVMNQLEARMRRNAEDYRQLQSDRATIDDYVKNQPGGLDDPIRVKSVRTAELDARQKMLDKENRAALQEAKEMLEARGFDAFGGFAGIRQLLGGKSAEAVEEANKAAEANKNWTKTIMERIQANREAGKSTELDERESARYNGYLDAQTKKLKETLDEQRKARLDHIKHLGELAGYEKLGELAGEDTELGVRALTGRTKMNSGYKDEKTGLIKPGLLQSDTKRMADAASTAVALTGKIDAMSDMRSMETELQSLETFQKSIEKTIKEAQGKLAAAETMANSMDGVTSYNGQALVVRYTKQIELLQEEATNTASSIDALNAKIADTSSKPATVVLTAKYDAKEEADKIVKNYRDAVTKEVEASKKALISAATGANTKKKDREEYDVAEQERKTQYEEFRKLAPVSAEKIALEINNKLQSQYQQELKAEQDKLAKKQEQLASATDDALKTKITKDIQLLEKRIAGYNNLLMMVGANISSSQSILATAEVSQLSDKNEMSDMRKTLNRRHYGKNQPNDGVTTTESSLNESEIIKLYKDAEYKAIKEIRDNRNLQMARENLAANVAGAQAMIDSYAKPTADDRVARVEWNKKQREESDRKLQQATSQLDPEKDPQFAQVKAKAMKAVSDILQKDINRIDSEIEKTTNNLQAAKDKKDDALSAQLENRLKSQNDILVNLKERLASVNAEYLRLGKMADLQGIATGTFGKKVGRKSGKSDEEIVKQNLATIEREEKKSAKFEEDRENAIRVRRHGNHLLRMQQIEEEQKAALKEAEARLASYGMDREQIEKIQDALTKYNELYASHSKNSEKHIFTWLENSITGLKEDGFSVSDADKFLKDNSDKYDALIEVRKKLYDKLSSTHLSEEKDSLNQQIREIDSFIKKYDQIVSYTETVRDITGEKYDEFVNTNASSDEIYAYAKTLPIIIEDTKEFNEETIKLKEAQQGVADAVAFIPEKLEEARKEERRLASEAVQARRDLQEATQDGSLPKKRIEEIRQRSLDADAAWREQHGVVGSLENLSNTFASVQQNDSRIESAKQARQAAAEEADRLRKQAQETVAAFAAADEAIKKHQQSIENMKNAQKDAQAAEMGLANAQKELDSFDKAPKTDMMSDALYEGTRKRLVEQVEAARTLNEEKRKALEIAKEEERQTFLNGEASIAELKERLAQMKHAHEYDQMDLATRQELNAVIADTEQRIKRLSEYRISSEQAQSYLTASKEILKDEDQNQDVEKLQGIVEWMEKAKKATEITTEQLEEFNEVQRQARNLLDGQMNMDKIDDILNSGGKADAKDIEKAIKSLKRMKEQSGVTAEEVQKLDKKIAQLERTLKNGQNDKTFLDNVMKNINTAPIEDLETALKLVEMQIKQIERNPERLAVLRQQFKQIKEQIDEANESLKDHKQEMKEVFMTDWFSRQTSKLLNYLGVFGGFRMAQQQFQRLFQVSMQYDDALTDIRKTTDLSDASIRSLADGLKHIDTRTSIDQLNALAYSAGKLSVKSVSELMGFVRAADKLNVSLGEQLGQDATEQLMKISNVLGVTDRYGLEDAMTKTASAITYLAKNSAASGEPIVNFMKRTAGLSRQAGVSASELAGLAAAVSALNQPVEMSATSFSKMMVQMSKSYKTVGAALKMTDSEIETLKLNLETGRGMEAFLDMLRRVKEMGGLSQTAAIAKDLGSEGNRVIQTLTTLSSNYETIERMVRMSTDAFEENTVVMEEYEKKNANVASLFARLKNNFEKLFVSTEVNDWFREVLEQLQILPDAVKSFIDGLKPLISLIGGAFLNNLNTILGVVKSLIYVMSARAVFNLAANGFMTITRMLSATSLALKKTGADYVAYRRSIEGATTSMQKLNIRTKAFFAFLKTASFGNVFTALITIGMTIYELFANAEKKARDWGESISEAIARAAGNAQEKTEEMEKALRKLEDENWDPNNPQAQHLKIIQQLTDSYKDYLGGLDLEKLKYEDLAKAIRAANDQLQAKQTLDAMNSNIADINTSAQRDTASEMTTLVKNIRKNLIKEGIIDSDGYKLQSNGERVKDERGRDIRLSDGQIMRAATALKNVAEQVLDREADGTYSADKAYLTPVEGDDAYNYAKKIFDILHDNAVAGTGFYLNGAQGIFNKVMYNDIVESLANVMNIEVDRRLQVESARSIGNEEASKYLDHFIEEAVGRMAGNLAVFSGNMSLGGKFDINGDQKERTKDQKTGKENTDSTRDDWARRKEDKKIMSDDQRNKEIEAGNAWLTDARQLAESYSTKAISAQTEEEKADFEKRAADLRKLTTNVQSYVDILTLGITEQTDDAKSKIKKAKEDNKAAQALYQSIMDNIRDFYKKQEEIIKMQREKGWITPTRLEQLLEENEINLLNSQSIAEQRIIGEIDLKSWLDELGEMDARNIAGEAGQYVLNLIKSVTDPRNIGLIFNRTKNAVIQMDSRIGGEREEYKPEDDNMTDEQKEADRKAKKEADEAKMKEEQSKTSSISNEAKSIVARNQKNAVTFMDWAMKQWGLSPEQAAGFAGVLMEESRINPSNYNRAEKAGTFTDSAANGPDAYGAGIAQWSNLKDKSRTRIIDTRKDNIISILQKQTGKNLTEVEKYSLEEQMAAMAEEISSRYPGLIELLKQQADPTGAAAIILRGYENGGGGNLASVAQIDKYTWNAGWSDKEQTNPIKGYAGSLYGVWKQGKNGNMMYIPGRAELGASILGAYNGEDLSSFIVGDTTRTLGAGASRVAAEGNAFDANLRLSSDKKQAQITSLRIKQQERLAKLWLEDNPFGEIADKYQAELERMGVMLNDLVAENNDELVELQKNVMSAYLKIGKNVFEYDMDTSEGVERFRDYISQFPELAEKAQKTTVEELQAIYYKSYAFAQEYSEKIAKTFDKNRKLWENMFKKTDEYVNNKELQQTISMLETGDLHTREDGKEAISLGSKRATRYGGSERIAMKQDVVQKSLALNNAKAKWDNNILMAEQQVAAAEQIQDPDERERALQAANEQLELAKQRPDEVTNAINALIASMGTLKDATYEWAESMVSAFEKVADGFVPLREFYDDKGSFAQNVFGTKEERQKAFSEFIGDLKRSLRKALVEKAKEKTQEAVLNAVASRKELMQKAKDSLIQKGFAESELKHKQIVEEAKTIAAQKSQMEQNTISSAGTSIRQTNDTKEATTGMWGNFGKAISAAWADGGPFAGAVLAALVGATLSALMTMVFNMMGKGKGGGDTSVNTKLVSGMLTYDAGNVQSFLVPAYDDGLMPVMADNGKVYMAQPAGELGTGMVTRPTLTTIGGMPALVGEEGPEMVIGRRTTHALQMNRPDILRIIQAFDARHSHGYAKAYDSGNVSEVMGAPGAGTANESAAQMQQTLMMLNNTLAELQQKGIHATINKYGRGGLVDEVASGIEETRRVGSSNRVNRLFR